MIRIDYSDIESGWARVHIENEFENTHCAVSYLHDSLKNLALSAINIQTKKYQSVIFMDEPGEYKLVLERNDDKNIIYELRWFKEWASWNEISDDDYEVIMKGETTIISYVNQIRNILVKIFNEIGPEIYQEKWIEHKFPIEEYNRLV